MKRRASVAYAKSKTPPKKIQKHNSKLPRELSNDRIHYVKRHAEGTSFTVANTVFLGTGTVFSFNQVTNFAELAALYDQYKICGVKVIFLPPFDSKQTIATLDQPNVSARFMTAIDYNNSLAPASMNEIREYESCKMTTVNKRHERYIPFPKFVNTTGQNVNDWLSTAVPGTPHFGLKWGSDPTLQTGTLNYLVNVELVYYLAFKNIK